MPNLSRAVLVLLLINVAVFAAGLAPARGEAIGNVGALWYAQNEYFRPWQLLSYMFLNADFGHILFNMFALASFGSVLERQWGAGRFVAFYLLCGIGAGAIQLGVEWHAFSDLHARLVAAGMTPAELASLMETGRGRVPTDPALESTLRELYLTYHSRTVGASGAVYGLLVAFGCLYPNAKLALIFLPVPVAAKIFVPILLGLDLISGLTGFSLFGAGIAHFAHLGGALIGFLLMLLWRKRRPADGFRRFPDA